MNLPASSFLGRAIARQCKNPLRVKTEPYVVEAGDTVLSVAASHDVSNFGDLIDVNHIHGQKLFPGQELLIPKK